MRKVLKVAGIVLAGLLLLILAGVLTAYLLTNARMRKKYPVQVASIEITKDPTTIKRGSELVTKLMCRDCHSKDLGGKVFVKDPLLGTLSAKNLTNGKGGVPGGLSSRDLLLALRHGVRRDSTTLLYMPAQHYYRLSEDDLRAIIAYLQQVPPVNRVLPKDQLGPLTMVMAATGKLALFPAEKIDHNYQTVKAIKAEVSPEYGRYLSTMCRDCHKDNLKGGPPVVPGYPTVPDITSTGEPGGWTPEQFVNTLRTGRTPSGRKLDPEKMPWPVTREYSDVELKAIHAYLKSL